MTKPFTPPERGTPEYDAWLDGPRPEAGNGRGQWLRARQLRGGGDLSKPKRQSQEATASGQRVTPPPASAPAGSAASPSAASPNATRAVLEAIRDNPGALDSDRIRAAQQLIALDRGAEASGSSSDLVELRLVLETLDPAERLAWLRGELREGEPVLDGA